MHQLVPQYFLTLSLCLKHSSLKLICSREDINISKQHFSVIYKDGYVCCESSRVSSFFFVCSYTSKMGSADSVLLIMMDEHVT